MDSTVKSKPKIRAMTMAELLPGLSGICSKDSIRSMTTMKQPRNTMAVTRTAVKVLKPMTIAEMQADLFAFTDKTQRRPAQSAVASNKKKWNSSIKVENKFRNITTNENMTHNPVKKALDFQLKPKAPVNPRKTTVNTETPRFPKPVLKAKKALPAIRISGISNIPETPALSRKNRVTIADKENYSLLSNLPKRNPPVTPKSILKQKPKLAIPETPVSNISWKSSDTSFLQMEKAINDIDQRVNQAVDKCSKLENIASVSPPVSTPFKEYRNVHEFFSNSDNVTSNNDSASYLDNTLMSFDNLPDCKENSKREESVIVSLCDMLNMAKVTNTDNVSTELKDLLESEKQTKENIKMIENCIKFLTRTKASYLKRQQHVQKLIQEKRLEEPSNISNNKTEMIEVSNQKLTSPKNQEMSVPCSVIKSLNYKIPKKNFCLRKKVFQKSMPNVSSVQSPTASDKNNLKAHNMYMKMKKNITFLNTPMKIRYNETPDTPSVTSYNLQSQLNKLYNCS